VAGVDIRTVAGRLGHAGGGTTTLKVYAAWVTEADQRASQILLENVPPRPPDRLPPSERAKTQPQAPYEQIAADLRRKILGNEIEDGSIAPSVNEIASQYCVSVGTAHRALGLLRTWGLLSAAGRGVRPKIINTGEIVDDSTGTSLRPTPPVAENSPSPHEGDPPMLELTLVRSGQEVCRFTAQADATDPSQLARLLIGAARRRGYEGATFDEYELEVRATGSLELINTFVAL
jgi:integrase